MPTLIRMPMGKLGGMGLKIVDGTQPAMTPLELTSQFGTRTWSGHCVFMRLLMERWCVIWLQNEASIGGVAVSGVNEEVNKQLGMLQITAKLRYLH